MKYIINNQVVLSQAPEGPLTAHIDSFTEFISAQGYALSSTHQQVHLVADFSRWLKSEEVELRHITADHPKQYLQYRARQVKPSLGDIATFKHLLDFLYSNDIITKQKVFIAQLTPAEHCAQEYEQYLVEMRHLAKATILSYVPFSLCFLKHYFGDKPVDHSRLCARDVLKFVQYQAPRLHRKRAKLMTCALRSFLTYLRYRGQIILDLAAAVSVVPNWSMSSIPRAISVEHVEQLLASIDQHAAIGRRDYAILLLLARLGLRSSEVVLLELNDIDWNTGTLSALGKSSRRNEFPLSHEVGSAIAAYLNNGRPQSTSRRVFLRAKAPIRGFLGASAVGSIVRHSLKRAGINALTYGAHQFRHGLATEMLRQGASLAEIGDVLGHCNPQTTMIYAKVNIEALRTLALPWPGGTQ
jgi:site-specific recombinase XerD